MNRMQQFTRARRVLSAMLVGVGVLGAWALAAATPNASAAVREKTWSAGDCFASGNVDTDMVDLSSEVPCSQEHAVQVLSGAALPAALAAATHADLLSPTSSVRASLVAFADLTCGTAEAISSVYPKQSKAMLPLLVRHDITHFIPPAPGGLGWALPDEASFTAGVRDVLCAFGVNDSLYHASAGDVRRLGTSATLPDFRLCNNFGTGNLIEWVSCSKVHEQEALVFVDLPVTDQPIDVKSWVDESWAPFDAACVDFANVLVGAKRRDLKVIADVAVYDDPPRNARRMFVCKAESKKKTESLPPGSVVGLGDKKLAFRTTDAKS